MTGAVYYHDLMQERRYPLLFDDLAFLTLEDIKHAMKLPDSDISIGLALSVARNPFDRRPASPEVRNMLVRFFISQARSEDPVVSGAWVLNLICKDMDLSFCVSLEDAIERPVTLDFHSYEEPADFAWLDAISGTVEEQVFDADRTKEAAIELARRFCATGVPRFLQEKIEHCLPDRFTPELFDSLIPPVPFPHLHSTGYEEFSNEKLFERLTYLVLHSPKGIEIKKILTELVRYDRSERLTDDQLISIADMIVARNCPELLNYFLRRLWGYCSRPAVQDLLLAKVDNNMLLRLREHNRLIRPAKWPEPVIQQLTSLLSSEAERDRLIGIKTLPYYILAHHGRAMNSTMIILGPYSATHQPAALELIRLALSICFSANASPERIDADLRLIASIASERGILGRPIQHSHNNTKVFEEFSPFLSIACIRALEYANHEVHGPKAAHILASLITHSHSERHSEQMRADAALMAAIDAARGKIFQSGHVFDKVIALTGIAASEDAEEKAAALNELKKHVLSRELPPSIRHKAVSAIVKHSQVFSESFRAHILNSFSSPGEWGAYKQELMRLMTDSPAAARLLPDCFRGLAEHDFRGFTRMAEQLAERIGSMRRGGEFADGTPEWVRLLGAFGFELAQSRAEDELAYAYRGMKLYTAANGGDAAEFLFRIIVDAECPWQVRGVAAMQLSGISSEIESFKLLVDQCESIREQDRLTVVRCAGAAFESHRAQGAHELVIWYLLTADDPSRFIKSLGMPLTDKLKETLDHLKAKEELRECIDEAIGRMEALDKTRN